MPTETPFESTMMDDFALTVPMLLRHGSKVHGASNVLTWDGARGHSVSFAATAKRAERLAAALAGLGVGVGDRVGTFMWNNQTHVEAYFAVPCMGAVLHTLNLRLFPDQLVYVVNHAADKVVLVDASLVPALARVAKDLATVEHFVVVGGESAEGFEAGGAAVHSYAALVAAAPDGYSWIDLDERAPAALCYTTGTTGNPKGVAYSHRSLVLHTFGANVAMPTTAHDRALLIVPQFHAMAWGLPYACWASGADLLMPDRFLQAGPLVEIIEALRPTIAAAVPSIWNDLLHHTQAHGGDLSSLRLATCGGAAVPRALIDGFLDTHGVPVLQGWGMTETSPVAAIAWPPRGVAEQDANAWRAKTGRVVFGMEARIVDEDGHELPWDGTAIGEIEVRGPWVTRAYVRDGAADRFHDGWLRTGDVASIDSKGFIEITDRAKDIIKSGGEWISSVALENTLMAHAGVAEAAVIGVPDARWDERPLACVVPAAGSAVDPEALREFLAGKVAKWWLPERWCFLDGIPKTSVGKFDKKVLRARYAEGELDVITIG